MEFPLYIKQVNVENSQLLLEESFPKNNLNLELSLDNINGKIHNISSIKEYKENPLTASLESKLMNKAKLVIDFTFPMHTNNSTFYFKGSLGQTKFSYFDDIIYPVLGLKILKGNLDGLMFNAKANKYASSGTMTMLYHDLDATVYKHNNSKEKSKVLSWTVNTILHKSNPGHNKKVREAVLQYDRTIYKGLGNYLWKTIQSGIVNTVIPGGKTTDKAKTKSNRKSKKEHQKNKH